MDTLLLNARTVLKQATGIQIKNLVSKMLTICSLLFWDAGQGELTHAGHRLSKRIYHAVRILLLFIIASMVGPLHNHPQG